MKHYLELIRFNNCIIASIATLIGFLIISPANINLLFAVLSVFFICAGGQAINDVYDLKIDKKINKEKPIPSGKISKKRAIILSFALFGTGIIFSMIISFTAFIIGVSFAILLFIYAAILYKTKYVGNLVVALGTAFTFIFGAASAGNITLMIIVFATSAFFANMAREIIKDFQDIKKDTGFKRTLPMISKKYAKIFVIMYNLLAISFAIIAYEFFLNQNLVYLIIILLSTIAFGQSIKLLLNNDYNKAQKKCKKAMVFSLIAFASTIFK